MRHKTAAAMKIEENNDTAEYNRPERAFERLFHGRVTKPDPIHIVTREDFAESDDEYDFKPDFQFIWTNVLVPIQGPYHRTKRQQSKDRWRNSCLLALNYRVIEIDTELIMTKRYNAEMVAKVEAFLKGNRLSEHLYA